VQTRDGPVHTLRGDEINQCAMPGASYDLQGYPLTPLDYEEQYMPRFNLFGRPIGDSNDRIVSASVWR